jgi:hypothetical protein
MALKSPPPDDAPARHDRPLACSLRSAAFTADWGGTNARVLSRRRSH